jgi:hypothetical protein
VDSGDSVPFSAFSSLRVIPLALVDPRPPPLTQSVETVEKVPFQKLFLESGGEMLKSTWFWVPHTIIWQHFSDF